MISERGDGEEEGGGGSLKEKKESKGIAHTVSTVNRCERSHTQACCV